MRSSPSAQGPGGHTVRPHLYTDEAEDEAAMTKEEADRIDALYAEIIEWRREDSNRLMAVRDDIVRATQAAVLTHETDCHAERLIPMMAKVDFLYNHAQEQCAQAKLRRRYQKLTYAALGALCTVIGVATPYLLRLI